MSEESKKEYSTTDPHRVKRIACRASYTPEVIHAILDSAYVCHISFVEAGLPQIIPMTYWRDGEYVYFHSAARGRFASVCASSPVALAVTLIDALVLGHSPINHSVNFRSVVVHGQPVMIEGRKEKRSAMHEFFKRTLPGRWEALRSVRDDELDLMSVFQLRLDQVAAKVRNEFSDAEDQMPEIPVWTGILPCSTVFRPAVADARFPSEVLPDYLRGFSGKPEFLDRIDGSR